MDNRVAINRGWVWIILVGATEQKIVGTSPLSRPPLALSQAGSAQMVQYDDERDHDSTNNLGCFSDRRPC